MKTIYESAHICVICYPMKLSLAWDEYIDLEGSLTSQPYDHVMSNPFIFFHYFQILIFFWPIIIFKKKSDIRNY